MGLISFQIDQIPDLSLNKYQSLANTGIEGVLRQHENFLRLWHGIGCESNTSFHLLYVYIPTEKLGKRLKIFFILQGEDSDLKMIEPLLYKSPLNEFYTFKKTEIPEIVFDSAATLMKKERMAEIYNPMTNQLRSIHYIPKWSMNEGGRLYDLFKILETISQSYSIKKPSAYRIDVYPASMSSEVRNKFNSILMDLRGENDIKILKETESIRANNYAKDICKEYEDWLTNIETIPHFRINIYGFADSLFKAKVILNTAGSESLNEGDFSIAAIKPDDAGTFTLLSRMNQDANDYSFYSQQAGLKSWATTFCLPEVVPFFRLPVLYDGETIEIAKETAPIQFDNGIYLGIDKRGYPVKFALKDLTRHAFFTGMPGSGKTNTMLHLATQLHQINVPFLVFEPAKKEYRALLSKSEMQDIRLFSPHLQSNFPLHMNPFEFPKGIRLSAHINALLEVFEGSFLLEGPTYKFLSSSIQRSYTNLGWDIEDINSAECKLPFPTLSDVYNNLQNEIESSSYDAELKGNLRAFLQVRLGGLMERDAGELFNVSLSTLPPDDWLNISAIVELEVLAEQSKNFFVLLVCHYIVESLRASPKGGIDEQGNLMPVRHAVFIEEAHNIIAPVSQQSSSDAVNPKISATAYIIKMLAEVRALREAIIIADQLPTSLASEVTKNTGLKLVHRLTSQDDRNQIGTAISASALQLEQMATLTTGRAFIYHEQTMKPFELQVAEWSPPNDDVEWFNDERLYAMLWKTKPMLKSIEASFKNWEFKYYITAYKEWEQLKQDILNATDFLEIKCCMVKKDVLLKESDGIRKKCMRIGNLWRITEEKSHPIYSAYCQLMQNIDKMQSLLETMNTFENKGE